MSNTSPQAVSPPTAEAREQDRLLALERLDLLETPPEEAFDRLARLVRSIFDVPIALVSLMDAHRQWHKACLGGDPNGAERGQSFCRFPVATGQPLVVEDASRDPVVGDSPHVVNDGVRFYAGAPLTTRDGHHVGTICAVDRRPRSFGPRELAILQDLAQVAAGELELRQRADVDALTGLSSRRAFKEQAGRSVALALRHDQPLSVILIDIDRFKAFNDAHGHAAGDTALVGVAAACRRELRTTDLIGRLGGEEFAVALPHTDRNGALDVAEKLRKSIRRSKIDIGNVAYQVTASLGVSELRPPLRELDELLAQADSALYVAKAEGRDRCVGWRPISAAGPARTGRRRVLKAGRILFNDRHSTVDCTLRSLGDDGAGVDVWNATDVPDRFLLMVLGDRTERDCRVVARTPKHVEVEFT